MASVICINGYYALRKLSILYPNSEENQLASKMIAQKVNSTIILATDNNKSKSARFSNNLSGNQSEKYTPSVKNVREIAPTTIKSHYSVRNEEYQSALQRLRNAYGLTVFNRNNNMSPRKVNGSNLYIAALEDRMEYYRNKLHDVDPINGRIDSPKQWLSNLKSKLSCMNNYQGSVYLYHMRKAAGSSVENIFSKGICLVFHAKYYRTEGITLDDRILNTSVISVTSLRDPIERIISLYWYEHVDFWINVKHNRSACKTFTQWIDAW
jgi:hypothetical protein